MILSGVILTGFQDVLEGGGAGGQNQNAELGGVVMRHHDMVAADREQELPPGSQESIEEVDMMVSQWAEGNADVVGGGNSKGNILVPERLLWFVFLGWGKYRQRRWQGVRVGERNKRRCLTFVLSVGVSNLHSLLGCWVLVGVGDR